MKPIQQALEKYREKIYSVFASTKKLFEQTTFSVALPDNILPQLGLDPKCKHAAKELTFAELNLFPRAFPPPFCLCVERAGIMTLWPEYDKPKDEEIWGAEPNKRNGQLVVPYPVLRNLDFLRKLKNGFYKEPGRLAHMFPDILEQFQSLVGGNFEMLESIPFFVPDEKKSARLRMNESSGSVRALYLLSSYLYYIAAPGDILMIDEPELNLHPERQRQMARLLARLVNAGVKVFLTTHSDYLIRELNVLIMLKQRAEKFPDIVAEERYRDEEFLDAEKVKVYTAEKMEDGNGYTLYPADVNQASGIEVRTFAKTIGRTNEILEKIVYGIRR